MRQTTKQAIYAMFSSYPRSKEAEQDPDAYFAMVELGCDGLSDEAIQEAIKDVAQCKVKGVTPGFCPQHDIFTGHAAQINERNKLVARRLARPEIERPRRSFNAEYVHPATGRRTELIRAGYAVIAKDVSLEAARKAGAYPEGTVWLTTGEVLAPPAKQQKDAA